MKTVINPFPTFILLGYSIASLNFVNLERVEFKDKLYFSHGKIYTLPKNINLVACYHPSPRNVNTGRINEKKMKQLFKKALKIN